MAHDMGCPEGEEVCKGPMRGGRDPRAGMSWRAKERHAHALGPFGSSLAINQSQELLLMCVILSSVSFIFQ